MANVKDTRTPEAKNTLANGLDYIIQTYLNKHLNTMEVMRVVGVEGGGPGDGPGVLTVKPLVGQTDAYGKVIEPVEAFKVPYTRAQSGGSAVVSDPKPGDNVVVGFTKRDSSQVQNGQEDTVPPASKRAFSLANGVVLATMRNKAPETYIHFDDDAQTINNVAPEAINSDTKVSTLRAEDKASTETKEFEAMASMAAIMSGGVSATVEGGSNVNLDTPQTNITGDLHVGGDKGSGDAEVNNMELRRNLVVHGDADISGDLRVAGVIYCTDIIVNGIRFSTHVHGGVDRGSGNTDPPL